MIVTLNQRGEPVYVNGAPALLEASLRRLRNILEGQVLHCEDEAYSLCKAFHAAPHRLDMNGSHIDDISKAYREDNWDYIKGENEYEIGHFMVDYAGSIINLYGLNAQFFQRNFVSKIHIAQYHDVQAPATRAEEVTFTGTPNNKPLTDDTLHAAGYVLESSEWETLNHRAGGPTLAKFRHLVYRHKSIGAPVPLFLVDNTTWPVASTQRDLAKRGQELKVPQPKPVVVDSKRPSVEEQLDSHTGYRRPNWA
ncbi:hypothetical protein [Burkholderia phage FLC9]|nr:hypothetical protein [Burkholderia phage FLC9]